MKPAKCPYMAVKAVKEDEYDKFPCLFLQRRGIYPLTLHNRDLVEKKISGMSTYRSNLNTIVLNWGQENKYEKGLKAAIEDINRTNKTFLSKNEIENISSRILNLCKSKEELIKRLNSGEGAELIFKTIADKKNENCSPNKYHVSFATKFIVCMSKALETDAYTKYAKYDSVVSSRLPDYLYIYCQDTFGESTLTFKMKGNFSFDERLKVYMKYNDAINCLIEKVNEKIKNEGQLTLEELDHLIWFFGRECEN